MSDRGEESFARVRFGLPGYFDYLGKLYCTKVEGHTASGMSRRREKRNFLALPVRALGTDSNGNDLRHVVAPLTLALRAPVSLACPRSASDRRLPLNTRRTACAFRPCGWGSREARGRARLDCILWTQKRNLPTSMSS